MRISKMGLRELLVRHKISLTMKKITCLLISFGCFFVLKAQQSELTNYITNSLILEASTSSVDRDSCYYSNALLKIEVNKKHKVMSMELSDNASELWHNEVKNMEGKINKKKLDSLIKASNLKKCILIYPVFFIYDKNSCRPLIKNHNDWFINDKMFLFKGKQLNGKIIFGTTIQYGFF